MTKRKKGTIRQVLDIIRELPSDQRASLADIAQGMKLANQLAERKQTV